MTDFVYNNNIERINQENNMETTTMTIARALKEKNRVAARLGVIRNRIRAENSVESNIKRTFDINVLFQAEQTLYTQLIAIKRAITVANVEIAEKLIEMTELRGKIEWLRSIPTKEGTFQEAVRYNDNPIPHTYTAIMSGADAIKEIEEVQNRIDTLQDDIDEFNATKRIEVPALSDKFESTCLNK